jgi:serpin B
LYGSLAAALSLMSTFVVASAANDQSDSKDEAANAKVSEKFATNFFKLATKATDTNVVISPYSVSTALAMTYNGAVGKTKNEMQQVLGYEGLSDESVNKQSASLSKSLMQVNPLSELAVANALFAKQDAVFNQNFINTNRKYYGAKLEALNFANANSFAINKINDWVKENTKGKIPTILDKAPKDVILYLVNAIYFKGTWLNEFKKSETQTADFKLANGTTKSVQMMNRSAKMLHLQGDNFQAVMLPYKDNRLQMCIFLPSQNSNIAALIARFNEQNWQQWLSKFSNKQGHLALPRFKVEYKAELSKVLKEAGMPCAFNEDCADFKKMIDQDVFISRVLHRTYLEVNEKGTEAAAATAVEMMPRGAFVNPTPPFNMICDRPFVIAIRDEKTNGILLIGAIVDPPAAD